MSSNQYFRWNKQWLYLGSCLVSICLLPSTAESGMYLGDLRVNVQQEPTYTPYNQPSSYPSYNRDQNFINAPVNEYPQDSHFRSYPTSYPSMHEESPQGSMNPDRLYDRNEEPRYQQTAPYSSQEAPRSYQNDQTISYNDQQNYNENYNDQSNPYHDQSTSYNDRSYRGFNEGAFEKSTYPEAQDRADTNQQQNFEESPYSESRGRIDTTQQTFEESPYVEAQDRSDTTQQTFEQSPYVEARGRIDTTQQTSTEWNANTYENSRDGIIYNDLARGGLDLRGGANPSGDLYGDNAEYATGGQFERRNPTFADRHENDRADEGDYSLVATDDAWNRPTWDDTWNHMDGHSSCCMPRRCCWGNFRLFGDFLYWELCQDGLDYAVHVRDVAGPLGDEADEPVINRGLAQLWFQGRYKIKNVSTSYKPGFRIGGFYSCPCSTWEFGVIYTQLHSHYKNHTRSRCGTDLVLPTQLPTFSDTIELVLRGETIQPSFARSKLRFHYDMVDLLITTSYGNEGCLTWQPYIGARFLEIKEKWNILYGFSLFNEESQMFVPTTASSRWHSKIPAGGLTAGVSGAYQFCGCWSLIGRLGASCLGGTAKQHTRLNASFISRGSSSSLQPTSVRKKKCAILTGFEGSLGLAYTLRCCGLGVQFAAGYEFQNWYNVPTPLDHSEHVPGIKHNRSSNLTLHGLFVRAGVAF